MKSNRTIQALTMLMMTCYTVAVLVIAYQNKLAAERSARNVEKICTQLSQLTRQPCGLELPERPLQRTPKLVGQ